MVKKRILILGSGISGLSCAWHLSKKTDEYDCILLEKSKTSGGWMNSHKEQDFLIEGGPRVFKTSRNKELLQIVDEIGFSSSLLPSSPSAKARFLWTGGKFHKVPKFSFSLLYSLWKERKIPPVVEDETIWDFTCRRFGKEIAEKLIDPMVLGIYAGDSKILSVEACFPFLKNLEQEHGSVIKGMFSLLKKKRKKSTFQAPLFSFREGTGSFIQKWQEKISLPIHYDQEITSLRKENGLWKAQSHHQTWEGDEVILAIPAGAAAKLLIKEAPETSQLLQSIPYEDITTVHLGWKGDVLPFSAFGYLVPTIEKEPILGAVFDTKMFGRKDTLITVMIRGVFHSEEELKNIGKRVAAHHLKISQEPNLFSYKKMTHAIPQYVLGHPQKKEALLKSLKEETENLHIVGNYLEGVSVNDCIKNGGKRVETDF
jgi:oxygen-dependent protoporphyrinogen oxidase